MVFKQDFDTNRLIGFLGDYLVNTFTIEGTGFSTNPTGTARYIILADLAILFIPALSGTSNATTFTLQGIPLAIRSTRVQKGYAVQAQDNGVLLTTPAILNINAGATPWDLFSDWSEAVWTGSGTKGISEVTIAYTLL